MWTLIKRRCLINLLVQTIRKNANISNKCLTTYVRKLPQANILVAYQPNLEIYRTKSKNSKKKQAAAESDEDESDEEYADFDSLVVDKSTKIITTKVNSLRADVVLKSSLSIARNKVEEMFYQSKIRVNGKKIYKKSDLVQEGDEVDIVKGVSINNPKFLTVARVEILNVMPKKDAYNIRIRRCKNLTVENYEEAWKPDSGT